MKINVSVYGFYPIIQDHDDTCATGIPHIFYRINTIVIKLESRNLVEGKSRSSLTSNFSPTLRLKTLGNF